MAKKSTKKTENPEVQSEVTLMEQQIQTEIETKVENEISDIKEQMENLQPAENVIETIMASEPEEVEEIIDNELKKVDELVATVAEKINEMEEKYPEITKVVEKVKKANPRFTNVWNGIAY